MKNIYKYILSFVIAFVFGLLVFQPKVYASSSYISSLSGYSVVNDSYTLFLNSGYNEPNDIVFYIDRSNVWNIYFVYDSYIESNYFAGNFYVKYNNDSRFFGPYSGNITYLTGGLYNSYIYHIKDNSPTNVVDVYGQCPNYESIVANKNYLLVFDDNEEFRKYKLYVSSSPFYLRANEDKLLSSKGNLEIVNELSNMLDLYQTTSDGTAWEVVSHNLNSLVIYDKYTYLYDEKGANRLVNSLSRFNVSFEEFYNVYNHGNINYLDIKPTNSDLYNRVYMQSSDIPIGSQDPSQQIISSDKLDFLPESYDNSVNANEYPYIIYVYNVNDSNEYAIIGSNKALSIANNDYWPSGFVYKSLFPIFVETWEQGDIKIKYFRHLSNNYSDTKEVTLTSSSLDGNCYLVSPVATGYSTDNDGNKEYYARLKSNYNLNRADKNIYNAWFTSGDTIIKKEDIPEYSSDDTGVISSIINTLGLKFQQWFVPSQNHFQDLYNQVKLKFPFIEQWNSILSVIQNEDTYTDDPQLIIEFPDNEKYQNVSVNVLNFSWLDNELRNKIKSFTSILLYISVILVLYKNLHTLLGGGK